MVKTWPFQRLSDTQLGDKKVTTWIAWHGCLHDIVLFGFWLYSLFGFVFLIFVLFGLLAFYRLEWQQPSMTYGFGTKSIFPAFMPGFDSDKQQEESRSELCMWLYLWFPKLLHSKGNLYFMMFSSKQMGEERDIYIYTWTTYIPLKHSRIIVNMPRKSPKQQKNN